MKKICFCLILVSNLMVSKVNSQSRFAAYVGGGMCWYYGDLQPSFIPFVKTIGLGGQAGVSYQFYRKFGIALNYQYDLLKGSDGYAAEIPRRNRNLGFYSHNHEISLRLTYDILRTDRFKVVPYIYAGFGYFRFNPRAFDGIALAPLGTEGQNIGRNSYPQPYSNWAPSIPFGLGVKYRISCRFSLKAEITYHKTFTDYIDDVSSAYPDMASLRATSGDLAVKYSDRRTDPANAFRSRGNPKQNDAFMDVTLGLIIHFGRCNGNKGGIYEDCKALYKNLDKPQY
jgi:hypothetical protein